MYGVLVLKQQEGEEAKLDFSKEFVYNISGGVSKNTRSCQRNVATHFAVDKSGNVTQAFPSLQGGRTTKTASTLKQREGVYT